MKILVFCFVVIFLEICYGNDCGFHDEDAYFQPLVMGMEMPVNPYWSDAYEKLYFPDRNQSIVCIYHSQTGQLDQIPISELKGKHINLFIPIEWERNSYWVITDDQKYLIELLYDDEDMVENYELTELEKVINDKNLMVQHGRTDEYGRLFLGTKPIKNSKRKTSDLIKLEDNKTPVVVCSQGISSQISFSNNFEKMLIVNEATQQILLINYDEESGTVDEDSIRTVFDASKSKIEGKIVDAVFDTRDYIWIAFSGSETIIKYNYNTKAKECEMSLPKEYSISGITWGDTKLDTLYVVTTAEKYPGAGAVFAVNSLHARGVPFYTDINLNIY